MALRVGWHVWAKLYTPAGLNLSESRVRGYGLLPEKVIFLSKTNIQSYSLFSRGGRVKLSAPAESLLEKEKYMLIFANWAVEYPTFLEHKVSSRQEPT